MKMSENINELATALSAFQGEVTDAPKTKTVKLGTGGASFKHAELPDILELARPILSKNKLSIIQGDSELLFDPMGLIITLETKLMHNSGQWILSKLSMLVDVSTRMNKQQQIGSAITYARRNAILAMLFMSQVDDESELIEANNRPSYQHRQHAQPPQITHVTSDPSDPLVELHHVNELKALINGDVPTSSYIRKRYNITKLEQLTVKQYVELKDELRLMDNRNSKGNVLSDEEALERMNQDAA